MTNKKKQSGPGEMVVSYIKEVRAELIKVTWPTRQETIRLTIIVIIAAAAFGLAIGGLDNLLKMGIAALIPK